MEAGWSTNSDLPKMLIYDLFGYTQLYSEENI